MNKAINYNLGNITLRRSSNFELLRIVSMFLVLVVHADYLALGAPSVHDISTSFGTSFIRAFIEAMSCVCVNVFILISGWFCVQFKVIRLVELLFQVFFINAVIYALIKSLGYVDSLSIGDWIRLIFLRSSAYWFVKAYIILYVFTPVLNSFVNNSSRKQLMVFLVGFYLLQSIYGFYAGIGWYAEGYSPLSFMGLYVLARYMRLYPCLWMKFNKYMDIAVYLLVSALTTLSTLIITLLFENGSTLMYHYSSPLIILASIYFFLFFTKCSFKSYLINWVSLSVFAVYIVHCSDFIFQPYYLHVIRVLYGAYPFFLFLFFTIALIMVFFSLAILVDKVRIRVWKWLCCCLS